MNIVIKGAITNFADLSNDQLLKYLKEKNDKIEVYTLTRKEGTITSAALDWAIIGNISSVSSIVSLLWLVYDKFISRHKKGSDAGIIIKIENVTIDNSFWIGKDFDSKKELEKAVKDFLKRIKIDKETTNKVISEIRNSDRWKRLS